MKTLPILIFAFILSCSSCKNTTKVNSLERLSIESLSRSNTAILNLSNKYYASLHDRLRDETYGEKTVLWNNKAKKLRTLTNDIVNQVNRLNDDKSYSIEKIISLKAKYIEGVRQIDSTINKVLNENKEDILVKPVSDLSPTFIIEKTKNDILLLESEMSAYFDNKTALIIEDFTVFTSVVSQNTKHLKSGETLEITAAIGAFSVATNPTFIINGSNVEPDESATAKYYLKATGKGKKSIPIKINYTSNTGQKESKEYLLDYHVDE